MITAVKIVSPNEVVVEYDNRPPLTIVSDNQCAEHLVEHLLSPRWDMSYSEYKEMMSYLEEDTVEIQLDEQIGDVA